MKNAIPASKDSLLSAEDVFELVLGDGRRWPDSRPRRRGKVPAGAVTRKAAGALAPAAGDSIGAFGACKDSYSLVCSLKNFRAVPGVKV
jgi:hypothetical protein